MKKIRALSITMAMLLLLSACGALVSGAEEDAATPVLHCEDMFTDRDCREEYDEGKSVHIQLNGDSIESDSGSVHISGTTAVIESEGTYILSGTLNDGMIVVNAGNKDKLQLVLNGASIHNETSAPLYILKAGKVFLTLAPGTENTLSNGGTFEAVDENNIDATIFSKEDLTLNGSGSLTVISPAGHGITSKDDLVFTGGSYNVNAASHGLEANDSVRITNASISISAGKDGIHAENKDDSSLGFVYIASGTLNISAEGDGISAGAHMQIDGGSFDIVSGGGSVNASKQRSDSRGRFMGRGPQFGSESPDVSSDDSSTSIKGIKAAGDLLINSGSFAIDTADDAVHSNASITINGGNFEISTGDDGFHADDALTIYDGSIHITESYEGLEALHVTIAGGNIALIASDDGINAAGGTDSSGFGGQRMDDHFGGSGWDDQRGPRNQGGWDGQRAQESSRNRGGRPGLDAGFGPGGGSTSDGTIVISGGEIDVQASGDGIDANGTLSITGGHTIVSGPIQGDTATLDYDISGEITGGTFIGTGALGMAQTFSSSKQGVISVNAANQSAGTQITLADQTGKILISHTPELPYAVVILSSPELVKGETYTLTIGTYASNVVAN